MRKILFLMFMVLSVSADYDFSVVGLYRSYPLGAAIQPEVGLNQMLWKKNEQIYGFVREAAYIRTSGLINAAGARIEFFPISILGFAAGSEAFIRNNEDLDTFNCETEICDSDGTRSYLRIESVIGFGKFFFINDYNRDFFDYKEQGLNASAIHTMLLEEKDMVSVWRNIIGYKLNDSWAFGGLHFRSDSTESNQHTAYVGGFARYDTGKHSYQGVLGVHHDRFASENFSFIFKYKWTFKKSMRLF